jgi:hypothetical protein
VPVSKRPRNDDHKRNNPLSDGMAMILIYDERFMMNDQRRK